MSGGELVELVIAGRVRVEKGRLVVLDPAPTREALLDAALEGIAGQSRPPQAKTWVGRARPGLVHRYLAQFGELGVVGTERVRVLGVLRQERWPIRDSAPVSLARARLDAVALSSGPVELSEVAFGGLVHAVGLDKVLYPGSAGHGACKRLGKIAKRDGTSRAAREAADALHESVDEAVNDAVDVAVHAALHAAIDATVHAAQHASAHHGSGGGSGGGRH